jgi:hypothetical protein
VVLRAAHGVYMQLASIAAWIPEVTFDSGANTTHSFSGRFQFLAESYEMMVPRLNRLREIGPARSHKLASCPPGI